MHYKGSIGLYFRPIPKGQERATGDIERGVTSGCQTNQYGRLEIKASIAIRFFFCCQLGFLTIFLWQIFITKKRTFESPRIDLQKAFNIAPKCLQFAPQTPFYIHKHEKWKKNKRNIYITSKKRMSWHFSIARADISVEFVFSIFSFGLIPSILTFFSPSFF